MEERCTMHEEFLNEKFVQCLVEVSILRVTIESLVHTQHHTQDLSVVRALTHEK